MGLNVHYITLFTLRELNSTMNIAMPQSLLTFRVKKPFAIAVKGIHWRVTD